MIEIIKNDAEKATLWSRQNEDSGRFPEKYNLDQF